MISVLIFCLALYLSPYLFAVKVPNHADQVKMKGFVCAIPMCTLSVCEVSSLFFFLLCVCSAYIYIPSVDSKTTEWMMSG